VHMRVSFRRRIANWIVLLALALTGVAPRQDLVLCFEPDGTIALESVDLGRACGASAEHSLAEADELRGSIESCCGCFDVPIEGLEDEQQRTPERADASPFLPALPAVPLAGAWIECVPLARVTERADVRPSGTLARLRTDVLRL